MPKNTNPCATTVTRENAYEVWQTPDGTWTWYVLKKYQNPQQEAKNSYARWLCNVVTLMTSARGDTGDVYVAEITAQAVKLDYNPLSHQDERTTERSSNDGTVTRGDTNAASSTLQPGA